MAGVDVDELEAREEAADEGDDLVGHVLALGAADEEGRALEAGAVRVREGEAAHLVELAAEDGQGDAEFLLGVGGGRAVEVAEEELADGEFLCVLLVPLCFFILFCYWCGGGVIF